MKDFNKAAVAKIKELRIQKNISQNTIAESLSLTVTAYNRIENGKTQLTINNLYTIAEALSVDVAIILQLQNRNAAHNYNSIVMTNFNNGHLNISINPNELFDALNQK